MFSEDGIQEDPNRSLSDIADLDEAEELAEFERNELFFNLGMITERISVLQHHVDPLVDGQDVPSEGAVVEMRATVASIKCNLERTKEALGHVEE